MTPDPSSGTRISALSSARYTAEPPGSGWLTSTDAVAGVEIAVSAPSSHTSPSVVSMTAHASPAAEIAGAAIASVSRGSTERSSEARMSYCSTERSAIE